MEENNKEEVKYNAVGSCLSMILLVILFFCFISVFAFKKTPIESAKIAKEKTVENVKVVSQSINWGIIGIYLGIGVLIGVIASSRGRQ